MNGYNEHLDVVVFDEEHQRRVGASSTSELLTEVLLAQPLHADESRLKTR